MGAKVTGLCIVGAAGRNIFSRDPCKAFAPGAVPKSCTFLGSCIGLRRSYDFHVLQKKTKAQKFKVMTWVSGVRRAPEGEVNHPRQLPFQSIDSWSSALCNWIPGVSLILVSFASLLSLKCMMEESGQEMGRRERERERERLFPRMMCRIHGYSPCLGSAWWYL